MLHKWQPKYGCAAAMEVHYPIKRMQTEKRMHAQYFNISKYESMPLKCTYAAFCFPGQKVFFCSKDSEIGL